MSFDIGDKVVFISEKSHNSSSKDRRSLGVT